jgi:hypothetical protein
MLGVVPPPSHTPPPRPIVAEFVIAAGPTAPAAARNAIGGLTTALPEDVRNTLRLIASELVTYGVLNQRGAGAPLRLRVARHETTTRLEISVVRHGAEPEAPGSLGRDEGARFRSILIGGVGGRWGVEMRDGAVVWIEVDDDHGDGPEAQAPPSRL